VKVTDEMVDEAVEVYRPSGLGDRRTTREAMRDALEAVLARNPIDQFDEMGE
jgi:hypothetical protein